MDVADLDETMKYLEGTFGLKKLRQVTRPDFIVVWYPGLELWQAGPDATPGVVKHVAWQVDDIDQAVRVLKERGATFESDAPRQIDVDVLDTREVVRFIFFTTPGGLQGELYQVSPPACDLRLATCGLRLDPPFGERIMTERELFGEIMFYGSFDKMPVWYTGEWTETAQEWARQGLPLDADRREFFNVVSFPWTVPTDIKGEFIGSKDVGRIQTMGLRWPTMLYPPFEEEILEETDEYRIIRQNDGVVAKEWKHRTSIPHYLDYTFKDGSAWPEYKRRLQPHPARIPKDLDKILAEMRDYDEEPIRVRTGSLVGVIRNWMGVENFCYLQHDDQDLLSEIVDTIADLACWELDQILPKVKVDLGWVWEDISSKSGPFISPKVFEKCVVPGYQKISSKLRQYGVELYAVDSDGILDPLIPGWLEGGVNIIYPVEIGTWQADPMELRKRYGRELRIIGGIDKREIAKGRAAIDAEIERRLPLMHAGGYIPAPDHEIIPGTSLQDYQYYVESIRALRF
jgi:uroporphyrinogen decarboxylase